MTVVSEQFYNEILRVTYRVRKQENLHSVKTADGKEVPVVGAVSFSFLIGSVTYKCNAFIVSCLAYNIVLGRDFLHEYSAVIDVRKQFVLFAKEKLVCFACGDSPPVKCDIEIA